MIKGQISSDSLLFSILRRQEHCLDSCSEGPNELLLDTADGSNTTAERNFALDNVSCARPTKWKGSGRGGVTVMAIVGGTVLPEKREIRAIACARPAEGPS